MATSSLGDRTPDRGDVLSRLSDDDAGEGDLLLKLHQLPAARRVLRDEVQLEGELYELYGVTPSLFGRRPVTDGQQLTGRLYSQEPARQKCQARCAARSRERRVRP